MEECMGWNVFIECKPEGWIEKKLVMWNANQHSHSSLRLLVLNVLFDCFLVGGINWDCVVQNRAATVTDEGAMDGDGEGFGEDLHRKVKLALVDIQFTLQPL